ncbi:MAG: lipid-A-disaccharide synthase [Puniceicoccaceae bacterium]
MEKPDFEPFGAPRARPDLLLIAGEHSGDEHAGAAVKKLKQLQPNLEIAALGGPNLEKAGADLLCDMTRWSIVGLVEVVRHYGFFRRLFAETLRWIEAHRPRVICLVDYPGFNLRLADELKRRGLSRAGGGEIRVVFYISPQIWAWKAGRRFKMAESLDELGVIFPFEVDFYRDTTLKTRFLGHPFTAADFELGLEYDPGGPILLLPGSRRGPVQRIFPVLLNAYAHWARSKPEAGRRPAVVRCADDRVREVIESLIKQFSKEGLDTDRLIYLDGKEGEVRAAAVLTSSGTMSLKCALAGVPGAIVYRTHPLTFSLGKRLVKVRWLGIANILLDRPVYPEYLQGAAKPEMLATELDVCLNDSRRREETRICASELWSMLAAESNLDPAEWLGGHLSDDLRVLRSVE